MAGLRLQRVGSLRGLRRVLPAGARALDVVERDSVQLTLLNNLNASILFLPFVLGTGQLRTVIYNEEFHTITFWGTVIATGVLGFAIAWISAVQIDLTSPVTHHISANSKAVVQTIMAVVWSHDIKPLLWWVSVMMVIGGALSYAVVRVKEESSLKAAPPAENGHLKGISIPTEHKIQPV